MDPKIQELDLTDDWKKTGMAAYDGYIRNGLLTQLRRLDVGDDVEEAHMRNRQWIGSWVFEKGKAEGVIEKISRDGKTYYNIKNYERLRELFGELLKEAQRIKSEGDFQAAKNLVENYGVKVDPKIHQEVLDRTAQFKSPPYSGFVNPVLVPEMDEKGEITAIKVEQPKDFTSQMLEYSKNFNFLKPEGKVSEPQL
jgi:dipeptidyl-peptidase-3